MSMPLPSTCHQRSDSDRPIKVMHVVTMLGHRGRTGGMEYGVIKLAHGLRGHGVSTSVCSSYEPDPAIEALLPADAPRFHCGRRPGHDLQWVWRLTQRCREYRPDVLHTHGWGTLAEGLLAARLARVPFVVHGEHGTTWTRPRQLLAQRWLWRRVDRVLAVSSLLADRLARTVGFPRERIHVIRNGVDLDRFRPSIRDEGRRRLDLSPGRVAIGTVGRFSPVKHQANLLDALALVRDEGIEFTAVLAGEGRLRPDLEAQCARLGLADRVRFIGHRRDVEHVIAALDVFVLPSRSEGLSNTILEAISCGVPVVATDVGGARELITDGCNGLLVPPQDPVALARAISALARDAARRLALGLANRRRAEAEFGLDTMLRSYAELYASLGIRGTGN